MDEYLSAFVHYSDFRGRTSRREYWTFALVQVLVTFGVLALGLNLGLTFPFAILYELVSFTPALAIAVRRLHDTNRSGLTILWALVPAVGSIVVLLYLIKPGDLGENRYGRFTAGVF